MCYYRLILTDHAELALPKDLAMFGVDGANPAGRAVQFLGDQNQSDSSLSVNMNLASMKRRADLSRLRPARRQPRPRLRGESGLQALQLTCRDHPVVFTIGMQNQSAACPVAKRNVAWIVQPVGISEQRK